MGHTQYLLLMAACVVVTAPLEIVLGVRVYRSPRRLFLAIAPPFVLFALWDLFSILRGDWRYNPAYVTGMSLGPIPVEELVFFAVIPLCGLLTYEAVGKVAALARQKGPLHFRWAQGLTRGAQDAAGPDA